MRKGKEKYLNRLQPKSNTLSFTRQVIKRLTQWLVLLFVNTFSSEVLFNDRQILVFKSFQIFYQFFYIFIIQLSLLQSQLRTRYKFTRRFINKDEEVYLPGGLGPSGMTVFIRSGQEEERHCLKNIKDHKMYGFVKSSKLND